jgi:hypothetical protein
MKKSKDKKLTVSRQTVRVLQDNNLTGVGGGSVNGMGGSVNPCPNNSCSLSTQNPRGRAQ